jgi:hypothetical protein
MAARHILASIFILMLFGCGSQTAVAPRLALLAPFEGQNRDIGYNALYAARLALAESESNVELVLLDDGGIVEVTIDRAKALAGDPLVLVVILLPHNPILPEVQRALDNLPSLIVNGSNVNSESSTTIFQSSTTRLDEAFTTRYLASDPFAEPPDQLATLVYDATRLAVQAARTESRAAAFRFISENID